MRHKEQLQGSYHLFLPVCLSHSIRKRRSNPPRMDINSHHKVMSGFCLELKRARRASGTILPIFDAYVEKLQPSKTGTCVFGGCMMGVIWCDDTSLERVIVSWWLLADQIIYSVGTLCMLTAAQTRTASGQTTNTLVERRFVVDFH